MKMKEALKLAALIIANIAVGTCMVAFGADAVWGRLDRTTNEVEPYFGEVKPDAQMYADGWKKVTETRDERPIGSLADYKYIWQPTAWTETETTLTRHWKVIFCKDITQVTADVRNEVAEVNKEVAK